MTPDRSAHDRRPRHRVPPTDAALQPLIAVAAVLIATAPIWPVYGHGRIVVVAALAAVIGAALGAAGAVRRWRITPTVLTALGAYLATGVGLGVPHRAVYGILPTPSGVRELARATVLSWKQLVTAADPVGTYEALAVPVVVMGLVGALVSVRLALRRRGTRWAPVPALVIAALSIALGPSLPQHAVANGAALFVVLVAWMLWLTSRARRRSGARPAPNRARGALSAAALVAVFALVAAAAGGTAAALAPATAARQVVRDHVVPHFDPRTLVSPLTGLRAHFEPEQADVPMLTVSGLHDARVRLATLDTYDGVVFSMAAPGADRDAFARVPAARRVSDAAGSEVTAAVTVEGYSGPWVPSVGSLLDVTFEGDHGREVRAGLVYDEATGTLASSTAPSAGDAYVLRARQRPWGSLSALSHAQPVEGTSPHVPELPDGLETIISRYAAGQSEPGARLAATLRGLTADGYLSHGQSDEPPSRSGHSLDRLGELLGAAPMIGDDEQYSVIAALAARKLGFDSRVVVGYHAENDAAPVTFYGRDAAAWVEIRTSDGWMPLDPTPTDRRVPDDETQQQDKTVAPPAVGRSTSEQDSAERHEASTTEEEQRDDAPEAAPARWFVPVVASGGALALLLVLAAPALTVVAVKAGRRRRRRTAPQGSLRVLGGWEELLDAALDNGTAPLPTGTRLEWAGHLGGDEPHRAAVTADRAAFGGTVIGDDAADELWRAVAEYRARLAQAQPRRRRLAAALSLRSFRWRRRRGIRRPRRGGTTPADAPARREQQDDAADSRR